jgi:hypothetical protein
VEQPADEAETIRTWPKRPKHVRRRIKMQQNGDGEEEQGEDEVTENEGKPEEEDAFTRVQRRAAARIAKVEVEKRGRREGPPPFPLLQEGLQSGVGRRGLHFAVTTADQHAVGRADEAKDYSDFRSQIPGTSTIFPGPGRTPIDPARLVRYPTECNRCPIDWYDKKLVWYRDEQGQWKPRKILQPAHMKDVPKERLWTLWTQFGGPFREDLLHEDRVILRGKPEYRYFYPRTDYNYTLIPDPHYPDTLHAYWAVNPEVENKSWDEIEAMRAAGKVGRTFSDWRHLNETEMRSYLQYEQLLIRGNALQHPANWNYRKAAEVDFHRNELYGILANPMRDMALDAQGLPIYEREDEKGAYYHPRVFEQTEYRPLIGDSDAAVQEQYDLNKGYGIDFDPSDRPRDVYGYYYDEIDEGHSIVPDRRRIEEKPYKRLREVETGHEGETKRWRVGRLIGNVLTFCEGILEFWKGDLKQLQVEASEPKLKPEEIWGPPHSVVELMLDAMGEAHVELGKEVRSNKIHSQMNRLFSTAKLTWADIEKATSSWFVGPLGGMAERCIDEATYFLGHLAFWSSFTDPAHGFMGSLRWGQMTLVDFKKMVAKAPEPTILRAIAKLWQYFHYDPIRCDWGWDRDGKPRVPKRLIQKLVRDPSLGGLNMIAPNGRRVLANYREKVGDVVIQAFWNMSDAEYQEALAQGKGDELTMGYVFWRPMEEAGDLKNGFLRELFRSQSVEPIIQQLTEVWNMEVAKKTLHIRPVYYKEVISKLPEELLRDLSEPDRPQVERLRQEVAQKLTAATDPGERRELEERIHSLDRVLLTARDLDRLTRFIQDLNRRSDRRIRLWSGFLSHGRKGGVRGLLPGKAVGFCEEAYGTQTGLPKEEQQGDQADLAMMAWLGTQVDPAVFLTRGIVYLIEKKVDPMLQYELVGKKIDGGLHPKIARQVAKVLTRNRTIKWEHLLPEDTPEEVEYLEGVFEEMEKVRLGPVVIRQIKEGRMHEGLDDYV